jgi:hypothetical protein
MTDNEMMHQLSQGVRNDDLLTAEERQMSSSGYGPASLRRSILVVEARMPGSWLQRQALTWPTTDRPGDKPQAEPQTYGPSAGG